MLRFCSLMLLCGLTPVGLCCGAQDNHVSITWEHTRNESPGAAQEPSGPGPPIYVLRSLQGDPDAFSNLRINGFEFFLLFLSSKSYNLIIVKNGSILIVYVCVYVREREWERDRMLKMYSHSKFQVYRTIFLSMILTLYTRTSNCIHLTIEGLYPLPTISSFSHSPSPWQPPFYSLFLWDHNGSISFILWLNNILLYIHNTFFIHW